MGRGVKKIVAILVAPVLVVLFSGTVQWRIPDRTAYGGSASFKDPVDICLGVMQWCNSCIMQWWCQ